MLRFILILNNFEDSVKIVYFATRENKCLSRVEHDFFLPRGNRMELFSPQRAINSKVLVVS